MAEPTPFLYMAIPTGPQPIPVIRDGLEALAHDMLHGRISHEVAGRKLQQLANSLRRKAPIGVARKRLQPLSEGQKEALRAEYRANPWRSQLELAFMFKTNPGRVSEALNENRN